MTRRTLPSSHWFTQRDADSGRGRQRPDQRSPRHGSAIAGALRHRPSPTAELLLTRLNCRHDWGLQVVFIFTKVNEGQWQSGITTRGQKAKETSAAAAPMLPECCHRADS